jgi:CheY-like chemotaxis protein
MNHKFNSGKISILLAEDDLINQKVFELMVHWLGHSIDIAGNGKVAVEKFIQKDYNIIFMDISMPVMSGLDAAKAIRTIERNRNTEEIVKIIAYTTNNQPDFAATCQLSGMDGILIKPLSLNKLEGMIKMLHPHLSLHD